MCGIVGYIGKKRALPIVLGGLQRLEYRGYDSVGVLIYDQGKKEVYLEKQPGRINGLMKIIDRSQTGTLGIGHSRWATHGKVNKENSHPHWDCAKKIFVVHNGIIENFQTLKETLFKKGHKFVSQTDTEVVPHLIEELINEGLPYEKAVIKALKTIRGSFALLIFNTDFPDLIVGARLSSPLALGIGKDEFIFASDSTPIAFLTKKIIYLEDGQAVFVNKNGYEIKSFSANTIEAKKGVIDFSAERASKGNFPDFMLKEIFEEPQAVKDTLRGRLLPKIGEVKLGGLESNDGKWKTRNNVLITGCGTAFFAAKIGEYMFEEYAKIPAKADLASELRYCQPKTDSRTLLVAISQSGETADTLAVIKEMKNKGVPAIGIVNVVGSSIARTVDAGIYSHVGPEIAVASTKAFLGQIADLVLLIIFLARPKQMTPETAKKLLRELSRIPGKIEKILAKASLVERLAVKYQRCHDFLFLGRKYSFPVALEGALKLKEIAYVHAEGLAAGETKHGPIALIDKNVVSVAICPKDSVYEKTISNLQEIKARNGKIIAVASKKDKHLEKLVNDVIYVPETIEMLSSLLTTVPLHLFAYYFAKKLGRDVDRPRNLAKSVTVE
jgi:glucosamine--fructose-6-phosphate aminotransferase (isomerizing)